MKRHIIIGTIALFAALPSLHAAGGDDPLRTMVLVDQLESSFDATRSYSWEMSAYGGYDLHKLYFYSEGEADQNGLDQSQNDLVYSYGFAPFWDIQAGIAYDKNSDASQTWGEVALSGLAPYWFEVRTALLFNDKGNVGLRLEAEYEMLLTQRLIATPQFEADLYTKNDARLGIGSGLSSLEAGIRLRYEIRREFAPYVGVTWEKTFGDTRNYRRTDNVTAVAGLRFWF